MLILELDGATDSALDTFHRSLPAIIGKLGARVESESNLGVGLQEFDVAIGQMLVS